MQLLQDRVVIVTGGFGALGQSIAAKMVELGARVALVDRAPAAAGAKGTDRMLLLGGVDVGEAGAMESAVADVVREWSRIDALVNVAGGFVWETVVDGSLDTWDRMYQMNLRSAVAASRAVLPHLVDRGARRVVNVGALAAAKATAGMGAYAASKAGVMRFTEALADELKDRGVTINAVLPSIIDTPANREAMPQAPFERWVTPQALARVVAFLLSDDAAPITGACLPVSGLL
jgi:NAD(P)-dependent dehydrogenase (short-subunit alcohol dehydrogenase family)